MADQEAGAISCALQRLGGQDKITGVAGEGCVRKFALRMAKAGEVKPQNGNAHGRKPGRDPARGGNILGTGETMGKERRCQMRPFGQVEAGGELMACVSLKGEALGRHGASVRALDFEPEAHWAELKAYDTSPRAKVKRG